MPAKRFLTDEEQHKLRASFYTDLGLKDLYSELGMSYRVIMRYWKMWFTAGEFKSRTSRLCSINQLGSSNSMSGRVGCDNPRYRKEGYITSGGYRAVDIPDWWTGGTQKGRLLEHIKICCESLGLTALPVGCCVHHIDHDKLNNKPDNLVLLTISEHMKYHQSKEGKDRKVQRLDFKS